MNIQDETPESEDAPLSPEQMLALAENQQRSIEGQIAGFVPAIVLAWAVAWIVGFGALWLIDGPGAAFSLPLPVAVAIFIGVLAVAIATSVVLGMRANRGLRGGKGSAFSGSVYGFTWWIGSVAIAFFAEALRANGMPADLLNVFYPTSYLLFAGIMYLAAGAIWRAVPMVALGIWTVVVAVFGAFFGYPTHYLIYALAGGGGFLVAALWTLWWVRRVRRAATGAGS